MNESLTAPFRPVGGSLLLVCMLALVLASLTAELSHRGPKHWMECVSLMSAQESWLADQAGDHSVWLIPQRHGKPRIVKPPLVVWADLLVFTGMDPRDFSTSGLIVRARLIAVGMGFVLLLSVYWIGRALRDETLGLCAMGVVSATVLFQSQARMASYDIYLAALCTLSVALLVWGLRPFDADRPQAGRFWSGSILSGVALGAAWLAKGPLAVPNLLIGVAAMTILASGRRRSVLGAAGVALIVALLLVSPWYLHVAAKIPGAWEQWLWEWKATGHSTQKSWSFYLVNLLRHTLPWTIWLLAALAHPFWIAAGAERRRRLFPWLWALGLLVFYSLPGSKAIRYIIPAAAPLGLMVAWVWRDHAAAAAEGNPPGEARLLWWPHWIMLTIASLGLGAYLYMQPAIVQWGVQKRAYIDGLPWALAVLITPALLALAIAGWKLHSRGRVRLAFLATWAWAMIALAAYRHGWVRTHDPMAFIADEASAVRSLVGEAPLRQLRLEETPILDQHFIFHLRQVVPRDRVRHLPGLREGLAGTLFLAAPDEPDASAAIRRVFPDADAVLRFKDYPGRGRVLWKLQPPGTGDLSLSRVGGHATISAWQTHHPPSPAARIPSRSSGSSTS